MPYPKISAHEVVNTTGFRDSYNNCSQVGHTPTTGPISQRDMQRDAVVTSPLRGDGFRSPTNFSSVSYGDTFPAIDAFSQLIPLGQPPWNQYCGRSELSGPACFGPPNWPSYPYDSNLQVRAETQALLKLQNQKVNLAQEFARAKQTAGLFNEFCSTVYDLYSAFKRNNPGGYARAKAGADAASAGFLSYVYGWRPEMSAIYESATALRAGNSDFGGFRCSVDGVATSRVNFVWKYGGGGTDSGCFQSSSGSLRGRCSLVFKLNVPLFKALGQYGITNPAYVIWDKIPWSFVVDWAVPVGNWLNTMTADYGWDFVSGTYSTKELHTAIPAGTYFNGKSAFPAYDGYLSTTGLQDRYEGYHRSVYGSKPVPGLFMKNPLKTIHVLEGIALLKQAIK